MKIINKYKFYILSFLVPLLILLFYITIRNIHSYNLIVADLREQYIFLFDYLKDIFNGHNSIFYNFGRGLGGSMFGNVCYYLISPFNLLILFANAKNIHLFLIAICFLKISLAGLTMYIYLSKSNKNKEFINFVLAISYSLMNYTIAYFFQIMWLDIVYLAPLILLGLDKIINNKKSKSYIFLLFLSIICNYYLSYMLCLFLIIYFIYRIITKYDLKKDKEKIKEITKKFIISSLLSGILASFILIPIIYELSNAYRVGIIFDHSYIYNPFNSTLKFSVVQSYYSFYSDFFPHILCGFIPIVILLNYLFKVEDKNKKYIIIMFSFMFLSFVCTPLVKLWHGFEIPIYLFHRWAFLFSLFMIIIVGEKYPKIKKLNKSFIIKTIVIYFILIIISYIFSTSEVFDEVKIATTMINTLLLFLSFIVVNKVIKKQSIINKLLLFGIEFITIIFIFALTFEANCTVKPGAEEYNKDYNQYLEERYDYYHLFENFEKDYYRFGGEIIYTTNESFNTKYGRNQLFVSGLPKNLIKFYMNVGHRVSVNEYVDTDAQIIINPLLGVKYWYGSNDNEDYKLYKNNKIKIYKNDYALNIGYMINYKNIKLNTSNPFEYQNSIFKSIYGKSIWKKYNLGETYYSEDSNLYFYADGYACDKEEYVMFIIKNQDKYDDFCDEYGIIKLNVDAIEDIVTDNKEADYEHFYFYYLDHKELNNMFDYLSKEQINITKIEKNRLEFNVTNKINNTLLLTIPYDKGWTIYVDGKKTEYTEILDTFIGIKLDKGKHKIKMIYYPKYLKTGIIVSSIDLVCIIIYLIPKKKRKR